MGLDVGCQMFLIFIEALIIICVAGSTFYGATSYDYYSKLNKQQTDALIDQNYLQILAIAVEIISALLFLNGTGGIFGVLKRNENYLCCFHLANFLITIIFGALGALSIIAMNQDIFIDNCNQTDISERSTDLNNVYIDVENYFCKKNGCQCYFTQTIQYNQTLAVEYFSSTDSTLPVRIQECINFSSPYNLSLLRQIEAEYECSGWCTAYPIYLFTNVNYGYPQESCSVSITYHYKNGCLIVGYFAFSTCSIMLLCNICALCLCFNTKNKFKESFYSSFTD